MKATRAYIASLGTTGVLLAASVLMLAVVSTLVAFDGWPSGTVTARVERLMLNDRAVAIPVSARAAAAAPRPAAAATGAPAGGTQAPGDGNRGLGGERLAGLPTDTPAPAPAPGGGRGATSSPVPAVPPPSLPIDLPGAGSLKEQTAQRTQETTSSLGSAVGGQAGEIVTSAGQSAADAVRSLPVGSGN